MFRIKKVYQKRAMAFCPYHESQKGSADLDITLEGPYAGKWHCWGCPKNGKITDQELQKLRAMRTEKKSETVDLDWGALNLQYIKQRFQSGVFPPLSVRVPVLAALEWGWDGQAHTFPERNEKDEIIGILRRFPDRNKGVVSGSKRGLTIPRINFDSKKTLYITEGMSDLSVILECGMQGIARPNCHSCLQEVVDFCRLQGLFYNYKIIADCDAAGWTGAGDLKKHMRYLGVGHKIGPDVFVKGSEPYNDLYEGYQDVGLKETKEWLLC